MECTKENYDKVKVGMKLWWTGKNSSHPKGKEFTVLGKHRIILIKDEWWHFAIEIEGFGGFWEQWFSFDKIEEEKFNGRVIRE